MGAIVGLMRLRGGTGELRDLWRMAGASVSTPGRDSAAWQFSGGEGQVGLGWLPAAYTPEDRFDEQPLRADGLVMVADARLDNRAEIQAALGIPPAAGSRLSDGALILEAYRAWREHTPGRLLGDFAFAVWEERRCTLFCARDHRGKRPLFYHWSPHAFAVASSLRALLALPHVQRRLNEPVLADFMAFMGYPATTLFDGLLRLPPAHTLTADADGVRLREYWRMDSVPALRFGSDEECLEAFRAVFVQAVDCRLRSSGPIGAFLSGGLDSSSVACVAAHLLKPREERLATFTAVPREGFEGPKQAGEYNDETPFVQAMCAMHGNLDASYVRTGETSFLNGLDRSFELLGFPVANPPNRMWLEAILGQAAARGLRVLLNGGEGNLWTSYKGASRDTNLSRAIREIRSVGVRPGTRTLLSVVWSRAIAPLLPKPVWRAYCRARIGTSPWSTRSPMRAEFAAEMRVAERYWSWSLGPSPRPGHDGNRRRIAAATESLHEFENDFHNAARLGYGVDMRDPTADKRVIEFCLALPEDQYSRAGQHRLLVRRGMKGFLPREVLWNQRRGVQAADWYEGIHAVRGEIARELALLEGCDTAVRCLDLPRMRRALRAWPGTSDDPPPSSVLELEVLSRGITVGRFIRWVEAG